MKHMPDSPWAEHCANSPTFSWPTTRSRMWDRTLYPLKSLSHDDRRQTEECQYQGSDLHFPNLMQVLHARVSQPYEILMARTRDAIWTKRLDVSRKIGQRKIEVLFVEVGQRFCVFFLVFGTGRGGARS